MLEPEPVADDSLSSIVSRRDVDQGLVAQLKVKGYAGAAEALRLRFER
jgi:hypothetical protein